MSELHTWGTVAVIALITAALRFLPFIIFNSNKKAPKIVEKLGRILPYSVMGMLVVYCLKGVSFTSISGFMPALIACTVVGLLYVWKRSTLISIICGTVCYMLLVQIVF
ncbi:MAG: branched-chain amino acid transporter AzlD [Ruminococcaceae bacterium]|nr:branched-chain amino acid transporter AzlD [Oscillospiraceae bacterium]